ncbi:MAG: response regulator transcription factor [Oscillospiraceae bacterium]|nr:response regulator transcription factor [Oscillospiraceae bacterium]
MFNILVVEDDKELCELFCTVLSDNGYNPIAAPNGAAALEIFDHEYIDLIISDIMMPVMNGYELVRQLRNADFTLPVLMITAKDNIKDKQEGFLAGTDDYMVKPVDVNEMIWRVAALLRRAKIVSDRTFQIGGTILNCDSLSVEYDGSKTILPQKEFFLLYKLVSYTDRIFTRRQIFDEIWGMDSDADIHTLEVHISRLRERFRNNPDFEIVTVRGLGYKAVKKHE